MPTGVYPRTDNNAMSRFLSRIQLTPNECWEWTGTLDSGGYGQISIHSKHVLVHRFAYECLVGIIPDGLQIDHLCRNRRCVNPAHLELVTHQENCRRGDGGETSGLQQRSKTHCPQGHPYDSVNTYHRPDGWRDCKICRRTRTIRCLSNKKA